MNATGVSSHLAVSFEEALHLVHDIIKASGLVSGLSGDSVPVHRVGDPQRGDAELL